MKFAEEKLTEELLEEVKPLLEKHWEEVAFYKDIPLNPDYDLYLKMQHMGMLRCYSVRDGKGDLIGYSAYVIKNHPHYKNSLWASQDIIYIDKTRRGVGLFLVKWCDDELKKIGVQIVSHHIKVNIDWSAALIRLGYDFQDKLLTKRLDK